MDVILTPPLCRAARGLLGWAQADLAQHTSLSVTAVKAFEGGAKTTRPATRAKLQRTFEENGVEFPATGGLRLADETASILRCAGKDYFKKFYDDLYASYAGTQRPDILTSSVDQRLWWLPENRELCKNFIQWVATNKIRMRTLLCENNPMLNVPTATYRLVPQEMLGKITYSLHADRIAFFLSKKKQIIIIRHKPIVETFRAQFDYLWKLGKGLSE